MTTQMTECGWTESQRIIWERNYPNEWVAADATGVIAHSSNFEILKGFVEATGKTITELCCCDFMCSEVYC